MNTKTTDPSLKPSFTLLDQDEPTEQDAQTTTSSASPQSPTADEAFAPSPAEAPAPQPQPMAQAADQEAAAATKPAVKSPLIKPDVYVAPEVGSTHALSERAQAEVEVASTSKGMAVDIEEKSTGPSTVKLAIAGSALIAAAVIAWGLFGPATAPAPASLPHQPVGDVAGPVTGAPTGQTADAPAPTVGIDIASTQAIELEAGEIDMVQQWAPVAPGQQSCTAESMSQYLQAVCGKVGQARYFQCAPDGYHWDPRLPGCESV